MRFIGLSTDDKQVSQTTKHLCHSDRNEPDDLWTDGVTLCIMRAARIGYWRDVFQISLNYKRCHSILFIGASVCAYLPFICNNNL